MIVAVQYSVEYEKGTDRYRIHNLEAPICPDCGLLLTGYDTRPRHVIDSFGNTRWFGLRRLRCSKCGKLHLEMPDFMRPKKHYEAKIISDVIAGRSRCCPADTSTIWRWKHENHPPGLHSLSCENAVSSACTNEKRGNTIEEG